MLSVNSIVVPLAMPSFKSMKKASSTVTMSLVLIPLTTLLLAVISILSELHLKDRLIVDASLTPTFLSSE